MIVGFGVAAQERPPQPIETENAKFLDVVLCDIKQYLVDISW